MDEQQPAYIGMYDGRLMDEDVRAFVESCDQVVTIGTLMTDFNTGAFTARIDPAKTIDIAHHHTRAGSHAYPNVEMGDILTELAGRVTRRGGQAPAKPGPPGPAAGTGSDPITAEALYPRWAEFLRFQATGC